MSHSLNEIEALCKRAARGAGFDWGLAEEAANAARWLSAFDLPGPRLLTARLERFDRASAAALAPVSFELPWQGVQARLCPIIVGASLSDRSAQLAAEGCIEMHGVLYPLLCCPCAADVALSLGTCVRLEWSGMRLTSDGRRLVIDGSPARLCASRCRQLACSLVDGTLAAHAVAPRHRARVDPATWARLSVLAARTFAPASPTSRRLGAGGADGD